MQVHQLRYVVDHLLRVLQRPHPLADHLRADHLVVVEAHPAVGLVLAGGRLADVVQQRRPAQHQIRAAVRLLEVDRLPQHRQRMLVDVLVLMVFVDGHPHRAHLGQHHIAQAGLHHQVDAGDRVRAEEQLVQFGGHPLGGDPVQLRRHLDQGRQHPRRDGEARAARRTAPPAASAADRRRTRPPVRPGCPALGPQRRQPA